MTWFKGEIKMKSKKKSVAYLKIVNVFYDWKCAICGGKIDWNTYCYCCHNDRLHYHVDCILN